MTRRRDARAHDVPEAGGPEPGAPAPDVSVVVVSYRTPSQTVACLDSVVGADQACEVEIVLVDNGSGDGTVEQVRARFPEVTTVALDENIGFARAVNVGVEFTRGEFVLLLNPDTVLVGPTVDRLVAAARRRPGHGLYGGRTLAPDGSLDPRSCHGTPTLWSMACFALGLSTAFPRSRVFDPESLGRWARDDEREVGVVTGCLCLVPRDVWDALEGFDPRFFMYGEDADLSMRAATVGLRPLITPHAVVVHEVGASTAQRSDRAILVMRSKATLARKHWPGWRAGLAVRLLQFGSGLRAVLQRVGLRRSAVWGDVWRRRHEWRDGYPEVDAGAVLERDLTAAGWSFGGNGARESTARRHREENPRVPASAHAPTVSRAPEVPR